MQTIIGGSKNITKQKGVGEKHFRLCFALTNAFKMNFKST